MTETVKDEIVDQVLIQVNLVIKQLDLASSGLQAQRRELFRLLMQLKGKDA